MLIQKAIADSLDLSPKDMDSNIDRIVMIKLNEKYVDKCYAGCFITRIINMSHSHVIMRSDKMGYGITDVRFLCEAEVYQKGEIIVGLVVKYLETDSLLICTTDHIIAHIEDADDFKSLKQGQTIPIRVINVTYPILQNAMDITASINIISYAPPRKIYKIILPKKVSQMKEFTELRLKLNNEIEFINNLSSKGKKSKEKYDIYLKFRKLIYPYKTEVKYAKKFYSSIDEVKNGNLMVDDTIYNDNLNVMWNVKPEEKLDIDAKLSIIDESVSLIKVILTTKILHFKLLRELIEEYDIIKYNSHKNVWNYFEKTFKKVIS